MAPESDDGDGGPARAIGAAVRPSGALTQVPSTGRTAPNPHAPDPAARAPVRTRSPYSAVCGRRQRQLSCIRGAPAVEGVEARGGRGGGGRHVIHAIGSVASVGPSRTERSRTVGTPARPRQVASAGAGAVLAPLPAAQCRRARGALPVQACAGTGAQGADVTSLVGTSCQLFSSHARSIGAPTSTLASPAPLPEV